MKTRFALICCLLLAGCSDADWDKAMSFGGMGEAKPARPVRRSADAATPVTVAAAPAEPANAEFCRAVATQDAGNNSGFDEPTKARIYAQSYAQCVSLNGR